ncbi:2,3-bisphosphoglycerate-independent phosphoglycerate mutase [Patescibacteria group bacterium]|nr:2,3-bisphosphoglycerate-independent phosphoglycerate mutase [Patescibacteria group bacterium]MBU1889881.1 2,3-bisphosphoglycerate-independent phosphoglycerate mutase [Patescibacteria group bacterium]
MSPLAKNKPVVLVIMDGWGVAPPHRGNAIQLGKTPVYDKLLDVFPNTMLNASSRSVGLPVGQVGNSEAGHMNIGAGRTVQQDSVTISKSITDGTFFKNPAFHEAIGHVKRNDSTLHLMGLLSGEQSAHSDPDHLLALLTMADEAKVEKIVIHLFTDGRDSPQYSSIGFLKDLNQSLKRFPCVKIASIQGRFYAMDRKKVWDRTESAYDVIVSGRGIKNESPEKAIVTAYNRGESDEFISPTVITNKGKPVCVISENDSIIYFNLRSDRTRQLTKAFVQPDFDGFKRSKIPKGLRFIAMTDFGPDLPGILTAYPSVDLKGTLPMALKDHKQLYISESEKYAHITYFLNGGYADPVAGEDRILIPSPSVKSYDMKPAMSANQITQVIVNNINSQVYDFYCVNFANADMVGHTGNLNAAISAVEVVDECVGKITKSVLAKKGAVFITADHGNADEMINIKTGEVHTNHTSNPVPFIAVSDKYKNTKIKKSGAINDITPTILAYYKIKNLKEMSNKSLCQFPSG